MIFLVNLILAILAGIAAKWLLESMDVNRKPALLVGILVGIVVYIADFARNIVG